MRACPRNRYAWALLLAISCGPVAADEEPKPKPDGNWHFGGYLDLNYAANFNTSTPHPWRSKATTNNLSQFNPDMGRVYLVKEAVSGSPWGVELSAQAGNDTAGQIPPTDRLGGANVLQYVSRANLSYQSSIGNGLKFVGGLMNSFIGYESFYAKDNPNYTRSWVADYSPYFLLGGGALYPVDDDLDVGLYLLTDYNYLGYVNSQPKYAGQVSWRLTPSLKYMQNVFVGPEQAQTDFQYWRGFSNSMLEWSDSDVDADSDYTVALVYDIGSQKQAATRNPVQDLWMGSAIFVRYHIDGPWSLGLRPELYWDPNGTMTGSIQFIKAITSTLEYKLSAEEMDTRLRLEYRYDNSTGTQGGFYGAGGIDGPLVPGQSTLFMTLLVSYDH